MPHPNPRIRAAQAARAATRRRVARRRAMPRKYRMKGTPLVRFIRRAIQRDQETKYVANQYDAGLAALANQWYSAGSLAAQANWYPAIPALGQGSGDYQRIGNKIHAVSNTVSLKIHFNALNLDANSVYGVIYYGTSKTTKSWTVANPAGNCAILDQGDGTNTTFNGNLYKLTHPIDKHEYNLKRIVFRLTKTPGIQNNDLSGNTVVGGNYATANGLQCRNFLLKFRTPKTIMYDQNTAVWPSNYAPVYAVGFCHADGSALKIADDTLVEVSSHCHLYFKDA